jgi:hypothetical protein
VGKQEESVDMFGDNTNLRNGFMAKIGSSSTPMVTDEWPVAFHNLKESLHSVAVLKPAVPL